MGNGWSGVRCPLGPGHFVACELGQGELLQAVVQDAGDGPGTVHRRAGDLVDEDADVVAGELGGAELRLEDLAGVLAFVPPGFGFGEAALICWSMSGYRVWPDGGGPQGEQVTGAAGPFLRLADLLGGRQVVLASRCMTPARTDSGAACW